jgi:hypothetical protein
MFLIKILNFSTESVLPIVPEQSGGTVLLSYRYEISKFGKRTLCLRRFSI